MFAVYNYRANRPAKAPAHSTSEGDLKDPLEAPPASDVGEFLAKEATSNDDFRCAMRPCLTVVASR